MFKKTAIVESEITATRREPSDRVLRSEVQVGSSRRSQLAVTLKQQVADLRKKFLSNPPKHEFDPILSKLTEYHQQLSSEAESIVTGKLTAEVLSIIENPDIVDDVNRPFKWSKQDVARLNETNSNVKQLSQQNPGLGLQNLDLDNMNTIMHACSWQSLTSCNLSSNIVSSANALEFLSDWNRQTVSTAMIV